MYVKVDKFNVTYYEIIFFGTVVRRLGAQSGREENGKTFYAKNEMKFFEYNITTTTTVAARKWYCERENAANQTQTKYKNGTAAYIKWLSILFIML